jgi:hypothetical protein
MEYLRLKLTGRPGSGLPGASDSESLAFGAFRPGLSMLHYELHEFPAADPDSELRLRLPGKRFKVHVTVVRHLARRSGTSLGSFGDRDRHAVAGGRGTGPGTHSGCQ